MGIYFKHWVEEAQRQEQERRAHQGEVQSHPGFGRGSEHDDDAWAQFCDYVLWLNEGAPEEEDDPLPPEPLPVHAQDDDYDEEDDE